MTAITQPPVGALVGFPSPTGRHPRFGLWLSADRETGEWWVLGLQHPHRRLRLDPAEVAVIADATRFRDVLHRLAHFLRRLTR